MVKTNKDMTVINENDSDTSKSDSILNTHDAPGVVNITDELGSTSGDYTEDDVNHDSKISVTAKNELFQIKIETHSNLTDISQTIDTVIHNLNKSKTFVPSHIETSAKDVQKDIISAPNTKTIEDKVKYFAKKLGIDPDKLSKSELIGITEEDVQIIKVNNFSPMESSMVLLAVKDLVFNERPISYDDWKDLCEGSGIISKTPFYQIAINAKKNVGYIDKKKHKEKMMMLSPNGRTFVKKTLKKLLE